MANSRGIFFPTEKFEVLHLSNKLRRDKLEERCSSSSYERGTKKLEKSVPRGIEFQIFGFRAPVLTRQACQLRQCCLDKTRNSPKSLQGNAMKCFEGLTMCSCSVTKIWESSEPVIVFRTSSTLLNSSLVFDFRGGVIKDSLPIQSLRDLIQEEEKKRNIPDQTPSPKMPIIPGKSGSTKKKLKYSTSLLKSLASL